MNKIQRQIELHKQGICTRCGSNPCIDYYAWCAPCRVNKEKALQRWRELHPPLIRTPEELRAMSRVRRERALAIPWIRRRHNEYLGVSGIRHPRARNQPLAITQGGGFEPMTQGASQPTLIRNGLSYWSATAGSVLTAEPLSV